MEKVNSEVPDNRIDIESALPETPSMTINDLIKVKDLVDTAASRGAFKASELRSVGELYEKLEAFLNHVMQQAAAAENKGDVK